MKIAKMIPEERVREAFLNFLADNSIEYSDDPETDSDCYSPGQPCLVLDQLAKACGFKSAWEALNIVCEEQSRDDYMENQ